MGIRKLNPTTPGQRFVRLSDFAEITASRPEKSLLRKISKSGGRNNSGKMTVRQIGGGHKRRYRVIDFKRDKDGVPAVVKSVEYDPNRSARIALLFYADGEKRYIIAPEGLKTGASLMSGEKASPSLGNSLKLKDIPLGSIVHNIELHPGKGGAMCRGAGTYAQLLGREGKYASLRLPSGETRWVLVHCKATLGAVGNSSNMNERMGKAGRNRWKGRRPRVRGVVMNPVDHPMGGGEGRASGGHPRSRTGIPAKGFRTRNKKKHSSSLIISRKKKRK